ncbi:UNVERIFIED_CONTAM: hypothetical protein GTU68_013517 [Idotea baltica]|nr:hypothetical protein [Idotea baltica]
MFDYFSAYQYIPPPSLTQFPCRYFMFYFVSSWLLLQKWSSKFSSGGSRSSFKATLSFNDLSKHTFMP